jgi:lipid-A-disaccharide synthase-like uncharacterized protein
VVRFGETQAQHGPVIFWWISTLGGLMLLTYGLLDRDPVIVMGQGSA